MESHGFCRILCNSPETLWKLFYSTKSRLFTYLFTTLLNVRQTIVARLINTNLTKTNTDIIDKHFKIFDNQHNNREFFVHDSISV